MVTFGARFALREEGNPRVVKVSKSWHVVVFPSASRGRLGSSPTASKAVPLLIEICLLRIVEVRCPIRLSYRRGLSVIKEDLIRAHGTNQSRRPDCIGIFNGSRGGLRTWLEKIAA